jgi:hypothetical protein
VVIDWKPIGDAATMSFANTLLRPYTANPSFDTASSSVVWTEAATGATADVAIVKVNASREGQPSPLSWQWRLAGMPDGASLMFPSLPSELAQFNVTAGDVTNIFDFTSAKVPGGYNAVRPVVLSVDTLTKLVAGPSGRIVVQDYTAHSVLRTVPKATTLFAPARSR